jgi:glutathione S-transferase
VHSYSIFSTFVEDRDFVKNVTPGKRENSRINSTTNFDSFAMSTPKLLYFDLNGRAGLVRLVLAAAGVAYDDVRFDASAFAGPTATGNTTLKFADIKATTPYGQLPVLEVNGAHIAQSRAIERYLAKEHGLFGKDNLEAALIDATGEQVRDLAEAFSKAADAAAKSKFVSELGSKAASLAAQLAKGHGFLVGDKLSYADLAFQYAFELFKNADAAAFDAAVPAALKAHADKIANLPNVAKYLAARPVRPF